VSGQAAILLVDDLARSQRLCAPRLEGAMALETPEPRERWIARCWIDVVLDLCEGRFITLRLTGQELCESEARHPSGHQYLKVLVRPGGN